MRTFDAMQTNKFSEIVLDEDDLCDLIMKGRDVTAMNRVTIDPGISLGSLISQLENPGAVSTWKLPEISEISVSEFDRIRQQRWFMPQEYRELNIAEHVLGLCQTQEQLQRVGQELLLYQERNLFDLLKYLKYLVDVMRTNNIIWGVGRGSSVSSYVLYLLGVHRIDSLYYDLDPQEFLR